MGGDGGGCSYRHMPPTHRVDGARHRLPQAPQLAGSPVTSVSHPLAALPSQLSRSRGFGQTHDALAQTRPVAHGDRHAPQLGVDALRSVSQPLPASPSQSPYPGEHVNSQRPVTPHVAIAAWPGTRHETPQQLPTVNDTQASAASTSCAASLVSDAASCGTEHTPFMHRSADRHEESHAPQWRLSWSGSTHSPRHTALPGWQ